MMQVETLLEQLDAKFDEISSQILDRSMFRALEIRATSSILLISCSVGQMSTRVDALEASLQDIINGDMTSTNTPSLPQSPLPGIKRNGTGLQ